MMSHVRSISYGYATVILKNQRGKVHFYALIVLYGVNGGIHLFEDWIIASAMIVEMVTAILQVRKGELDPKELLAEHRRFESRLANIERNIGHGIAEGWEACTEACEHVAHQVKAAIAK